LSTLSLESTTYPSTTGEIMNPILEQSCIKVGVDFFSAHRPECMKPGNRRYKTKNTNKVVGISGPASREVAVALYLKTILNTMLRASPSTEGLHLLAQCGATNTYHDPHIPHFTEYGHEMRSMGLAAETIRQADQGLILTDHVLVDYPLVVHHSTSTLTPGTNRREWTVTKPTLSCSRR